jgi:hypothetical protein
MEWKRDKELKERKTKYNYIGKKRFQSRNGIEKITRKEIKS